MASHCRTETPSDEAAGAARRLLEHRRHGRAGEQLVQVDMADMKRRPHARRRRARERREMKRQVEVAVGRVEAQRVEDEFALLQLEAEGEALQRNSARRFDTGAVEG